MAAHSASNRKKREKRVSKINTKLKKLSVLFHKIQPQAKTIQLPKVSLGDLRARFKHQHQQLSDTLIKKVDRFRRVTVEKEPLLIYGSDNGLLVAAKAMNDLDAIKQLDKCIEDLPALGIITSQC